VQKNGKIILLGSVLVVAVASVVCLRPDSTAKVKKPKLAQTVQTSSSHLGPGEERILATLSGESLEQSIRLLIDDREQYSFPFAGRSRIGPDVQEDLDQMLSTRRLWKALQEIKELPQSQGDAKCESLFMRGFQIHTNVCRAIIKMATHPDSFTNHESVLGPKMGMAAAMFIAADTARLHLVRRQFAMLDHWRTEIEPLAKQPDRRFVRGYRPALDDHVVTPDLRLQVNVLRLAALRSGNARMLNEVDEACAIVQMNTNTFCIPPWNAEITYFELASERAPNTYKDLSKYTFYDWSDKMELNHESFLGTIISAVPPATNDEMTFIKKLESIVFKRTTPP
jgi:hypothetical protein